MEKLTAIIARPVVKLTNTLRTLVTLTYARGHQTRQSLSTECFPS